MDIRLAEFAASLPDHWRINGRTTKHIIRKALAPRIPSEVLSRRKNGFRMPVTEWFRGPLREPFKELILSPDSVSGDYLDTGLLNQMIDAHASGRKNYDKSLWAFFALEVFLREFFRK
jgi:asparagine synthase (glutamine-hydrolysing)